MLPLKNQQEIEYRSYGLYSEVAKESGHTITDIETVYNWFLNKTLEDMITKPTLKVYLKNLGRFELDFGAALRYMRGHVTGLEEAYEDYINGNDRGWLTPSYFYSRYSFLDKAIKSLRERLGKIKKADGIRDLVYVNKEAKLTHIEKHLKRLYEPIQRIPEHELKRSPELGQSVGGDDNQSSK
jgi:hypothetical protein